MYVLYGRQGTGSDAPRILLEEAHANYEFIEVDSVEQRSQSFLNLNPLSQVPVLQIDGEEPVTESGAICLTLAEKFPEFGFLGDGSLVHRSTVYRWLFFAATNIYEDCRRIYHSDRYLQGECESALSNSAKAMLMGHWMLVNNWLADKQFVLGSRASVADFYFAMLCDWSPDRQKIWFECPAVARMCIGVGSRESAQKVGVAQH